MGPVWLCMLGSVLAATTLYLALIPILVGWLLWLVKERRDRVRTVCHNYLRLWNAEGLTGKKGQDEIIPILLKAGANALRNNRELNAACALIAEHYEYDPRTVNGLPGDNLLMFLNFIVANKLDVSSWFKVMDAHTRYLNARKGFTCPVSDN